MGQLSPVVVGILYPPEWYGSEQGFADEVAALEAVDPRVEVVVATYEEPHDLRTARGTGADSSALFRPRAIQPETLAALSRVHVVLAIDLPSDVTSIAPELAWVQAVGAGTSHLQALGLADAGIRLTSNGGSSSIAIAEFAFGRLIEERKRFRELAALQEERRWKPFYGTQLAGQTIGLVGYGSIGRAVAIRAAAFGMRVFATRRTVDAPAEPPVEHFFSSEGLDEMLSQCDAVIAAAPETAETIGLFGAAAFASMRPGAFFANVGRGSLVDQDALMAALRSGQIGAAALDVTSVEPLPADDPLWDAPNLQISGHCSSSPSAMFPNVHRVLLENLRRFVDGVPLQHEVSPDRGY